MFSVEIVAIDQGAAEPELRSLSGVLALVGELGEHVGLRLRVAELSVQSIESDEWSPVAGALGEGGVVVGNGRGAVALLLEGRSLAELGLGLHLELAEVVLLFVFGGGGGGQIRETPGAFAVTGPGPNEPG